MTLAFVNGALTPDLRFRDLDVKGWNAGLYHPWAAGAEASRRG